MINGLTANDSFASGSCFAVETSSDLGEDGSLNHELYLLFRGEGDNQLTLSKYIETLMTNLAFDTRIKRSSLVKDFVIEIDGQDRAFSHYQIGDSVIAMTKMTDQRAQKYEAIKTTNGRYLLMSWRDPAFGLRWCANGEISSPISEEEMRSILGTIPTELFIDGEDASNTVCPAPNKRDQTEITFFPSDFPQGSVPLTLPRKFVQEYCDVKFHKKVRLPGAAGQRRHNIETASVTAGIADMMYCIVNYYAPSDKCDPCFDRYCRRYDECRSLLTPREYVTFHKLVRELGIKEWNDQ